MKYLQFYHLEFEPVPAGSKLEQAINSIPKDQRPKLYAESSKEVQVFLKSRQVKPTKTK